MYVVKDQREANVSSDLVSTSHHYQCEADLFLQQIAVIERLNKQARKALSFVDEQSKRGLESRLLWTPASTIPNNESLPPPIRSLLLPMLRAKEFDDMPVSSPQSLADELTDPEEDEEDGEEKEENESVRNDDHNDTDYEDDGSEHDAQPYRIGGSDNSLYIDHWILRPVDEESTPVRHAHVHELNSLPVFSRAAGDQSMAEGIRPTQIKRKRPSTIVDTRTINDSDEVYRLRETVRMCYHSLVSITRNADIKLQKLQLQILCLEQKLADEQTINSKLTISNESLRRELQAVFHTAQDPGDVDRHHRMVDMRQRELTVEKHLNSLLVARNHATKQSTQLKRMLLQTCMDCRSRLLNQSTQKTDEHESENDRSMGTRVSRKASSQGQLVPDGDHRPTWQSSTRNVLNKISQHAAVTDEEKLTARRNDSSTTTPKSYASPRPERNSTTEAGMASPCQVYSPGATTRVATNPPRGWHRITGRDRNHHNSKTATLTSSIHNISRLTSASSPDRPPCHLSGVADRVVGGPLTSSPRPHQERTTDMSCRRIVWNGDNRRRPSPPPPLSVAGTRDDQVSDRRVPERVVCFTRCSLSSPFAFVLKDPPPIHVICFFVFISPFTTIIRTNR